MPAGNVAASIHWFRHGLRLHDSPALLEAIRDEGNFFPVFIFDGDVAGTRTASYNRMRFLLDALQDLDNSFRKMNGRLYVFYGDPVKIFQALFQEWGIKRLTFEQDPEPIWQPRDDAVKSLCDEQGVEWVEKISHTLWDPEEIIENNGGRPPHTYMLFNQVASSIGDPPKTVPDPDFSRVTFVVSENHDQLYGLPSIESMGVFPEYDNQALNINCWKGGESHALKLFENRMEVERKAFSVGTTMPNQAHPDLVGAPLSLSPHLRFGCLSVRKFYWALREAYIEFNVARLGSNLEGVRGLQDSNHHMQIYSSYDFAIAFFARRNPGRPFTISVCGQLMWREYFYTMSVNNYKYNKMEGNSICLQIQWYSDPDKLEKWTKGETGYPWIDAIMKQLVQEGWVHHVARHAVSTFLTRGDLWISWEEGLKVFDKYLLDADWSVCAGNWMWMSSSAFEKVLQCPKCFCPVRYGRKMDPSGEFVRRYLPVLKDMPLRYLFEPWKAPKAVQEKANCVVGVDYPWPMVDHQQASKDCYHRMTEVKNKIIASGDDMLYCSAANREEVRSFVWLPLCHTGDQTHTEEALCDGLTNL